MKATIQDKVTIQVENMISFIIPPFQLINQETGT